MKIKKGCTRIVFVFKRVVVKIPNFTYSWEHFIKGILSNISEAKTWRVAQIDGSVTYNQKHLLCPVLWVSYGGWLLVMPTAKVLTRIDWELIDDISIYKRHFGGDDTMSNYGYLDGRLVKIDYAQIDF